MDLNELREGWRARWPEALAVWSKFTRLREPRWCFTHEEAAHEGLTGSFAMIRLTDQAVVIDLALVAESHVEAFPLEILAHEIGHHVYAPANLNDNARMIARMRWALPLKEQLAGFIGNLYTDLLINDRLQRSAQLHMAQVYQTLGNNSTDRMWNLYMRMYEILWSLTRGTLTRGALDDQLEGDAQLGARLVRSYAREWLDGSGRFAALCYPYLITDDGAEIQRLLKGWRDMDHAGAGGMPAGLSGIEPGEQEGAIHPALDPDLSGVPGSLEKPRERTDALRPASGQAREPFQYGEILRSLGIDLDDHEVAVRYYKERAAPNLIRYPTRVAPETQEPLAEGLETWDVGSPLDDVDWMQSVLASPRVVPGLTTVQREYGTTQGSMPERVPLDLDLYVDSSGSMPNPQHALSYLTLAGAIVALSALRAGARVQATLWSGVNQFETTGGFVRDQQQVLEILTGYFGGATAFPIHVLRETFTKRKPGDRPAHILIISDDGVTTLFANDEQGNSGWDIARMALAKAGGGGTMVLNLPANWETRVPELVRARSEGWSIAPVRTWEELVEFARRFSRMRYGESRTQRRQDAKG